MLIKIKNILTNGLSKKIVIAVFILAAIDMLSMTAPYYLKYVIPHVYSYLGVTQSEFDQLNAVLGYVTIAMQLPSGWLADKVSGKKILAISCMMTGILTLMFALACQGVYGGSSLSMLYIIFIGFGISTTLFLWSPLWTVLSKLGNSKEQGKLYGLQGSYNGLLGLLIVTLIGTIATYYASKGNNIGFYVLVYLLGALLIVSAGATIFLVPETNEKSALLKNIKNLFNKGKVAGKGIWTNIKNFMKIFFTLRILMTAMFVLGMYMFQSIFAYYLKSYLAVFIASGAIIAALAGFRNYALRLIVSAPFGVWLEKRKSWIFIMVIIMLLGTLVAILFVLLGGVGNAVANNKVGSKYMLFLRIIMPILFIIVGIFSWFLVTGRYAQISEIPHTKGTYGTVIAIISLIAFSTDAWFYQMASTWMESNPSVNINSAGGYSQAGLQKLLFVALGIGGFATLCGLGVFLINKHEIKKLNKSSYRWRTDEKI